MEEQNYFEELYAVDVSEQIKKKNGLSFLPWAKSWAELKQKHPDATYRVYENEDGRFWFDDGRSGWVKVSATINGIEYVEHLGIMDNRNQAIPADKIMVTDAVNTKQRALTKAFARHGIGLCLYEGEELSSAAKKVQNEAKKYIKEITKWSKSLIEDGVDKDDVFEVIAKYNDGNKNPNSIKDVDTCKEILKELKSMEDED